MKNFEELLELKLIGLEAPTYMVQPTQKNLQS